MLKTPKGKEYECTEIDSTKLTADMFNKLKVGSKWEATISGLGSIKEIKGVFPLAAGSK